MEPVDHRITDFINEHHVLTLATSVNNQPWCAHCFYIYLEDQKLFVFTSDLETKHAQDALKQDIVAASVALETSMIGKIRGLQITGRMFQPDRKLLKTIKTAYLKKFPVAMLMKTTLWVLSPKMLKYTDNRLGFGKKLKWESVKNTNL